MSVIQIIDFVLIVILMILGIEFIIKLKKDEGKEMEKVKDKLIKRINIITILIVVIGILSIINIIVVKNDGKILGNELIPMKASNLINSKELSEIQEILESKELDNIDTFISWIKEYNKEPYENTGMVEVWSDLKEIKYNEAACMDRWKKNHDQTDSDCRMTAFLLLDKLLTMNKTISENGTYLMFDMDAIDNNKNYEILKEKRNRFITLFNEIDVKGFLKDEIKNVYAKKWMDYGISMKEGSVSLITVIMHDNYDNVVFVGHAGVLIRLKEKMVFIEKIAFEQPYQVSVFESEEELKNMLFDRESYFGDKIEEGPFIYENGKLIFTYK